jgi:AraC family transcriptional activator of pobA
LIICLNLGVELLQFVMSQDKIKVYANVNRVDPNKSFGISRMSDIYEKNEGRVDEPHRHDFYTILLVADAKGKHIIDFNTYTLTSNQVFFISPGQVHQVIEDKKSTGFAMVFSLNFLLENNIDRSFIEDLNLFYNYGQSPPLAINIEQQDKLAGFCEEIFQIYQSDQLYKHASIGAYLKLFLIYCNSLCSSLDTAPHEQEAGNTLLKKFRNLVDEKYKLWHGTSDYAAQLNISPDHLNRTIKTFLGKTAKEFVQTRIVIAAKRLLFFSELTTKEIAYELGFSEASHFSAFFKKETGVSPSKFRESKERN